MLLALAFSTKEDSNPQSSGDQAVGVGEVRLRDSWQERKEDVAGKSGLLLHSCEVSSRELVLLLILPWLAMRC